MSFAVTADTGRFEGGRRQQLVRDRARPVCATRNLLSPSYLWMLRDILTSTSRARGSPAGKLPGCRSRLFRTRHFRPRLLTDYLRRWALRSGRRPPARILDFPAEICPHSSAIMRCCNMTARSGHGQGGSQRYVEKLTADFRDRDQAGCAVTRSSARRWRRRR